MTYFGNYVNINMYFYSHAWNMTAVRRFDTCLDQDRSCCLDTIFTSVTKSFEASFQLLLITFLASFISIKTPSAMIKIELDKSMQLICKLYFHFFGGPIQQIYFLFSIILVTSRSISKSSKYFKAVKFSNEKLLHKDV